jgi:hypothetical protein
MYSVSRKIYLSGAILICALQCRSQLLGVQETTLTPAAVDRAVR